MGTYYDRFPRRLLVAAFAMLSFAALAIHPGVVTAAVPTQDVYFEYCGLEDKPARCDLRLMNETLGGSEVVSRVPAWFDTCGPSNGHPATTMSADGATAVTLEDVSKAPDTFGDEPVCRLAMTDLQTGEHRVLPTEPATIMRAISAGGWYISPNGEYIAINGAHGIYIQNVTDGSPPTLLRTGFADDGIAWYRDSSHLLIDGPSLPRGGRGSLNTSNAFFEYTITGKRLARWPIARPLAYSLAAPFIEITTTGEVYAAIETLFDPTAGGKPIYPAGYYSVHLNRHPSVRLITRVSRTGYAESISPFGVDPDTHLLFITGAENVICSVATGHGARHCLRFSGSTELVSVRGVELAAPPPNA